MPPLLLDALGKDNRRTEGAVEAYIYRQFTKKHSQLADALQYCLKASVSDFAVKPFIDSFWNEPGLKRSIDKIYEIIVYALFSTLTDVLQMQIEISIDAENVALMAEFIDFSKMVMGIDTVHSRYVQNAKIYRVGVTNAADRGLDMYSNWGPAIQIKHLSLDEELAEEIVSSVSSGRVVIVCKDAERNMIVSLLTQIGWRSHIQSIITENDLVLWYEKALRGKYAEQIGEKLLLCLRTQIKEEFPSIDGMPEKLKDRHYETINDPFWM